MGQLWCGDGDGGWKVLPLDGDAYALAGDPEGGVSVRPGRRIADEPALIRTVNAAGRESWVLVTPVRSYLRINGDPVPGIRVLAHKDEISVPRRGTLHFSTERRARIEPYTGRDNVSCPRCMRPLTAGQASVRCPRCRVAHHQMEGWECWTFLERCQLCDQTTRLDADFRWHPEDI